MFYIYDLINERQIGNSFDTLEQAEDALCSMLGINVEDLTDYLQSEECMYEIREED